MARIPGTELPLLIPIVYDPKLSSDIVLTLNHATLFDRNGIGLMDRLKWMMEHSPAISHSQPYDYRKRYQEVIDAIQANPSCFTVTKTEYQGCGTGILRVHFFESVYIVEYKPGQSRWEEVNCIRYYHHTFTSEMLYAIKYLQVDLEESNALRHFNTGMKIYKEHPECFHPKLEREEVDRKVLMERQELEFQKNQLRLEREALMKERQELEFQKNQFRLDLESDEIILLKPRQYKLK
jgi:hypothetical protein